MPAEEGVKADLCVLAMPMVVVVSVMMSVVVLGQRK